MALFDFLSQDSPFIQGIEKFISDPNRVAFLSDLGMGLSTGAPIGGVLGGATNVFLQRQALSKLYEEERQKREAQRNMLFKTLLGDLTTAPGNFLSPVGDLGGFDSVTMTNDGITMKMPRAPRQRDLLTEPLLESRQGLMGF